MIFETLIQSQIFYFFLIIDLKQTIFRFLITITWNQIVIKIRDRIKLLKISLAIYYLIYIIFYHLILLFFAAVFLKIRSIKFILFIYITSSWINRVTIIFLINKFDILLISILRNLLMIFIGKFLLLRTIDISTILENFLFKYPDFAWYFSLQFLILFY